MGKIYMVYIMASRRNGSLYVGFTGNPVGRVWQHRNNWFEGFTKRYGVHRLVWFEAHESAETAIRREKQIKEWHRAWKIRLIEEGNPDWRDLYPEIGGEA
jgi:putative endonuclease